MKMLTPLLRRSLQVHIALISLVYFPCFVLAIEPIGTIGQPRSEVHVPSVPSFLVPMVAIS